MLVWHRGQLTCRGCVSPSIWVLGTAQGLASLAQVHRSTEPSHGTKAMFLCISKHKEYTWKRPPRTAVREPLARLAKSPNFLFSVSLGIFSLARGQATSAQRKNSSSNDTKHLCTAVTHRVSLEAWGSAPALKPRSESSLEVSCSLSRQGGREASLHWHASWSGGSLAA